jgi:phosphatidylglycerol:prolipoprotein diacylglycerol transferase
MLATFVHQIDPIITTIGGVHLWWYGLSYTVGFLSLRWWLQRARGRLGLTGPSADWLALAVAAGVVLGGRVVEVVCYEWPFYRQHPQWIGALWWGGMATHGLLVGGIVAAWLFGRARRISWLALLDELTVPAAWIMGLGRLGNFIDGQIVGSVTSVAWAVQFPDAAGFRHPVVLYDGMKNLLLVPVLLWIRHRQPRGGVLTGNFLFWYGGLRVLVDVFREYPTTWLGFATGQVLNVALAGAGLALLLWSRRREGKPASAPRRDGFRSVPVWLPRVAFALLLAGCLTMPSDWTQDIPSRYGQRHPGLTHSRLYPALDEIREARR